MTYFADKKKQNASFLEKIVLQKTFPRPHCIE